MGKRKYNISKQFSIFALMRAVFNPIKNSERKKTTSRNVKIKSFDGLYLKITIIEPKQEVEKKTPCLVYFHGGAFHIPTLPYQLRNAHRYAANAHCKVMFVHYRLEPKHPFPVPVEDAYYALLWVSQNASDLGIDVDRIVVGGDSAGGALAAALTQMTRDRNGPRISFQLLIYPVTDCDLQTESMKKFNDTPLWDSRKNKEMWKKYLKNGDQGMLAYASPIKAQSLVGLPPAYVETSEFDCLRDDGINYARRLEEAGIHVELVQTEGTFHGFEIMYNSITKKIIEKRIDVLNKAFYS